MAGEGEIAGEIVKLNEGIEEFDFDELKEASSRH